MVATPTKHIFLSDERQELPVSGNGVEKLKAQRGFVVKGVLSESDVSRLE